MEYLFNGEFSYIMIIVFAIVGLVCNFIRFFGINSCLKESSRIQISENKSFMRVKNSFLDKLEKHQGDMNDVDVHNLVDKSMFLLKTCGLKILSINGFCKKSIVLVASSSLLISGLGLYESWEADRVLFTFLIGVLCTTLLITFETGTLFNEKKNIICINMRNYFNENLDFKGNQDDVPVEIAENAEGNKITEFPKAVSLKSTKTMKNEQTEKNEKNKQTSCTPACSSHARITLRVL